MARLVRVAAGMGADVSRQLGEAWSPLSICAARGFLAAVKTCLAVGAGVELRRARGWRALMSAAHGGYEAVVEALLEAGPSAQAPRLLATACRGITTPGIVRRLVKARANVNDRHESGTALYHATLRNNLAVMEALVDLGADVVGAGKGGSTPLHVAADGEAVRWLVARGASIQGNGVDESPLLRACREGRIDAVRALVELGADPRDRDWFSCTPLHKAVCLADERVAVELTRLLLAAGADPNAVDAEGRTPLHCVQHGACADLLLDAGADAEERDRDGKTAICAAATEDRREAALQLASRGAEHADSDALLWVVDSVVQSLRANGSGQPAGSCLGRTAKAMARFKALRKRRAREQHGANR